MNQRLSALTPTQIHAAGVSLLILVLATSIYAVNTSWQSRQSGIETSKLELTQISSELTSSQRERGRLQAQITSLQSIVQEHKLITQPTKINELAVQVVALAESHNLSLELFEPQAPITINGNPVQPITIRLSAPYKPITDWLNQIHTDMPDIHVIGLSIRSQNPSDPVVTSDIQINWYIPTSDDVSQ